MEREGGEGEGADEDEDEEEEEDEKGWKVCTEYRLVQYMYMYVPATHER